MAGVNQPSEQKAWLEEPRKLPDMLNVLTILTFIGCGLGALFSIYGYLNARSGYERLVEAQGQLDNAPAFLRSFMGPEAVEMARKSYENRLPILILSLVSYALCTYGALQMREFKKSGFGIYTIGELLPLAFGLIFFGTRSFMGFGLISIIFTALFIILYATQLKYLR
jgi:hypothetical protein